MINVPIIIADEKTILLKWN